MNNGAKSAIPPNCIPADMLEDAMRAMDALKELGVPDGARGEIVVRIIRACMKGGK